MLGLYNYKILSFKNQAKLLWEDGVYLDVRGEESYKVQLHSLYNFFVEVYYNPATNEIEKFRTFKSDNCLEPYLEKISIKGVL